MSELFPHESKLLKLNDPCLLDGCNEVGDSIVIETKINTVEGIISYIDTKGQIKIKYNALDAGYTSGYQLDNCEIEAIRCFVCCDDRYYELDSCELTTEALNALFGEDKPEGKIFAYSGDKNEPDCLYKYSGLGDFLDPDNWIDEYGRISAQLEDMPVDQLAQFVNWLSEIFEGNGISFNANAEDGKVVVTVMGDGYVGASSFVVSYEDGYIHFNPGDGSGLKTSMIVEHGDGPPSEPYDWFSYINDLTGAFYINNNGEPMLLGVLEGGNLDTCTGIVNCINYNLANPPQQDIYALPELDGAPWVINQVTYGEPSTLVADFSACDGTDLDDLVLNLNACPSNPLGWVWVNSGGVLKVCVAPGTNILTMSFSSPLQVVNFNGVPTTPGDTYPDLCKEISQCIIDRGLLDEHIETTVVDDIQNAINASLYAFSSFNTTHSTVETQFLTKPIATVFWSDELGYKRFSTKHSDGNWIHNFKERVKLTNRIEIYNNGSGSNLSINNAQINVRTAPGVSAVLPAFINRAYFSVTIDGADAWGILVTSPATGNDSDCVLQDVNYNVPTFWGYSIKQFSVGPVGAGAINLRIDASVILTSGVSVRRVRVWLTGFE